MILGVGIDIIEVARIRDSIERFGDHLLKRILRPDEIAFCYSHRLPGPHLAARFAAKEAVSKAFGTGIGRHLGWQDIEICRRDSGEPYVTLHEAGSALFQKSGARAIHLSLSHTQIYAAAMAVLES